MLKTTLPPEPHAELAPELVAWQQLGLDLTSDPDGAPSTLVHVWDRPAGRRAERRVKLPPRAAHAAGYTVAPLYPATTVTVDLDAPEERADGAPAVWAAAWRAANLLGLTVLAAPSGTERNGFAAQTGVVVAHTAEHAAGFVRALAVWTGVNGIGRVGVCNRTLLGWRDKPSHSQVYSTGGVLVEGGRWEPRTAEEARVIAARPSHVPAAQVDALLAVNGVHAGTDAPVVVPDGDGTIGEMRELLDRHRPGGRPTLLATAMTDGAGYNADEPASRHQGEAAVIARLVRAGYGTTAIQEFLAAHPIGARMREAGTAHGQHAHVRRQVERAAKLIARTGEVKATAPRNALGVNVRDALASAWAVPVGHEARVAFAVLASTVAREGRLTVSLGQLDLELLTGMDGCDAMEALRAHPCVDYVTGSRVGVPTEWTVTSPQTVATAAPLHAPGWEAVASTAGSPVVAGGGVGRRHRAHTALVLASIRDVALKPAEIATAIESSPDRVGRALNRLAGAGLTAKQPGARHRVVVPLWIGAMATGTAEHGIRKAAAVADRRAKRHEELAAQRAAFARRSDARTAGPSAAVVLDDTVAVDLDDPRWPVITAYVGDASIGGAVHRGLLAVVDYVLERAGGDVDVAVARMSAAADPVSAWVAARGEEDLPVAAVGVITMRMVDRIAERGQIDDADLNAVMAAGAAGAGLRIDWPDAPVADAESAGPKARQLRVLPRPFSDEDAMVDDGTDVHDPLAVVEPPGEDVPWLMAA